MRQLFVVCSLFGLSVAAHAQLPDTGFTSREVLLLMGSRFEIGAYAKTQPIADRAVATAIAEVRRIEALISSWRADSQTSAINRAAGGDPVAVDRELYDLIERSLKVSELTQGAFDITAGGLVGLYRFGGQDTTLPAPAVLAEATRRVGYRRVSLDTAKHTVRLELAGMRIGFGAIGKGYAANRARESMRAVGGVYGGVVNAAGDLATFGVNQRDSVWTIGISDPRHGDRYLGQLEVHEMAVVTSGDYERYFTAGGSRYAHILDPRTALPAQGVISATVVCPDAELADALATSLFVLGVDNGLILLNKLRNVEGMLVSEDGTIHTSKNLEIKPKSP